MTPFNTPPMLNAKHAPAPPSRWVRTRFRGTDKYELTVLGMANPETEATSGFAYAKLSLMESGAVLATFPTMGMVSGILKNMLGATCLELDLPLKLPASIFGHDIVIAAGQHPLVFVLESWVVLFRPHLE